MINVERSGGALNAPPIVTELQVVGEPTQTEIQIQYKVQDADLQIVRHYLTVIGVYDRKEITKEVGYDMPDGVFTYTITGLERGTEYTIQITCDDGLIEGQSNAIQASTTTIVYYSFTINESDSNPATRVSYGDQAVGITPANSTSLGGWENKFPFNETRIVGITQGKVIKEVNKANRKQFVDGSPVPQWAQGVEDINTHIDIMTEIPTVYWRKTAPSGQVKYEISDRPIVGGDCYAHKVNGIVRDKIYVGDYLMGIKAYPDTPVISYGVSMPGCSQIISNTSLSSFRNYSHGNAAHPRPEGYGLINANIVFMLQILWMLAYKHTNSQLAHGMGFVGASVPAPTGGTDSKGWIYGSRNNREQMCFLGIEDLWGNFMQWVDGLFVDNSYNIKVCVDNVHFNDTGGGTGWENVGISSIRSGSAGYTAKINTSEKTGFFPDVISGSATTYYADFCSVQGGCFAKFGGDYNESTNAGVFYLNVTGSATSRYPDTGARLVYIGEAM